MLQLLSKVSINVNATTDKVQGKTELCVNMYILIKLHKGYVMLTKNIKVEIKTNFTSNSLVLKSSFHNLLYLIVDHFVIVLDEISDSLTDHIDRGNRITGNHLRNEKELILITYKR